MPMTVPTPEEVQRIFAATLRTLPKCEISSDRSEFDTIFRGLLDTTWQHVGDSVEYIRAAPDRILVRVFLNVDIDLHKGGQEPVIRRALETIISQVKSIDAGILSVTFLLTASAVTDIPFAKRVPLMAEGVLYIRAEQGG